MKTIVKGIKNFKITRLAKRKIKVRIKANSCKNLNLGVFLKSLRKKQRALFHCLAINWNHNLADIIFAEVTKVWLYYIMILLFVSDVLVP